MSTQTHRAIEGPLNVVLRPGSEAAAAYHGAVLAPGFGPAPGLDLRFFGGRTLAHLQYTLVYVGAWAADDRTQLDHALSAAMGDRGLNNVLAQYFPGTEVTTTFAGSLVHEDALPARVQRDAVESLVGNLNVGPSVTCVLLPQGAVLVDSGNVDSKHGLGGYHGSIKVKSSERYYAVSVYSDGDNGIVAFDEPWKNVCATCTTSCRRRARIPTSRTRSVSAQRRTPSVCSAGTRRKAARSATSRWKKPAAI